MSNISKILFVALFIFLIGAAYFQLNSFNEISILKEKIATLEKNVTENGQKVDANKSAFNNFVDSFKNSELIIASARLTPDSRGMFLISVNAVSGADSEFVVLNGVSPYQWNSNNGKIIITLLNSDGSKVNIKALDKNQVSEINVVDSLGNRGSVKVNS